MKLDELLEGDGEPKGAKLSVGELKQRRLEAEARRAEAAAKKKEEPEPEEEEEIEEEKRGPVAPASDALACPAEEFKLNGIPDSYAHLKEYIEGETRRLERRQKILPLSLIAVWWAAPGVACKDAIPVSTRGLFLETPYTEGTYYVRVRVVPHEESAGDSHYTCVMGRSENEKRGGGGGSSAFHNNIALLHTNEQYAARITDLLKQIVDAEKARDDMRQERDEAREALAEKVREIAGLEALVEDLKAAGQPLFNREAADELGVKGIVAMKGWLDAPDKEAQKMIADLQAFNRLLFDGHKAFFKALEARVDILEVILRDAPDLYDGRVLVYNQAAETAGVEDRMAPAAEILKMLPPHEDTSDDALLQAAEAEKQRAEAAEAMVEKLRGQIRRLREKARAR